MRNKIYFIAFTVIFFSLFSNTGYAVEPPDGIITRLDKIENRVSENRERLIKLEEGQKSLEKRFDDLRSDLNKRFDTLEWMFGLFITVALVILAAMGRVLWDLNRRQAAMETSLETQKDEIAFLKNLIEKLLPPKEIL